MGLALALMDLLGAERVEVGHWAGPVYAEMTDEELEVVKDLLKQYPVHIAEEPQHATYARRPEGS